MYSSDSENWLRRQRLLEAIGRWRRRLLFATLAAVSIWALVLWRADHHTFAWDETIDIAVVALIDAPPAGSRSRDDEIETEAIVQRFLSSSAASGRNLRGVEEWLRSECARHSGRRRDIVRFEVRGPLRLAEPPPVLPAEDASFFARLGATRAFLRFFTDLARRDDLRLGEYDVTVFIYFYDIYDPRRRGDFLQRDSVASRRDRLGVVFAPLGDGLLGHVAALVAHEICHTFGATDKYADGRSVHPDGYADPGADPLWPQTRAEIMALGIPIDARKDAIVEDLADCIVGDATAREMGWIGTPQEP